MKRAFRGKFRSSVRRRKFVCRGGGGCKTWEIDSDVDGGLSTGRTRPEVETFVRGRS